MYIPIYQSERNWFIVHLCGGHRWIGAASDLPCEPAAQADAILISMLSYWPENAAQCTMQFNKQISWVCAVRVCAEVPVPAHCPAISNRID